MRKCGNEGECKDVTGGTVAGNWLWGLQVVGWDQTRGHVLGKGNSSGAWGLFLISSQACQGPWRCAGATRIKQIGAVTTIPTTTTRNHACSNYGIELGYSNLFPDLAADSGRELCSWPVTATLSLFKHCSPPCALSFHLKPLLLL